MSTKAREIFETIYIDHAFKVLRRNGDDSTVLSIAPSRSGQIVVYISSQHRILGVTDEVLHIAEKRESRVVTT